ncbi:uncharacterized protein LOC120357646 [Solenopsis invicta]|uniref:uncharacterized protein LOC120357646 n=1 Tax=Solenopsis invicta TaxID=13686 RepID=UPI00193CC41B|nr:uncharacterized protein LOC120357646 [Solenopsis invicta]
MRMCRSTDARSINNEGSWSNLELLVLLSEPDKEVLEISDNSGDCQPENECVDFEKNSLPAYPLCSKGNEPGGAHTCTVCGKPVHALDFCSVPVDGENEGYGQKRLCLQCHTQENVNDIIASQDFEDWGGQISAAQKPNKPKGTYLKNSYAQNALLLHSKFIDVPIIKNGGDVQLKGVKNKQVVITLQNTCSFDSFFQLFLCASFDYKKFADELASHQCNNFFKMVMYVNKKGINKSTYKQRCNILCEILEKTEPKLGCSSLLCNTTIGHISRQILKNYNPTFIERNICDQICTNKQRTFAVLH